ncbi:MAG TPA: Gfo/Idh/MocA family oxidoreductase [Bradyrhizobium sp.]|nr:Gfo/Idh/MocA family oxidoreductase [Bradyrhizobium sp.]
MRKIKWGLIGCGDIARRRIAPALLDLPSCELVAVSRANFDRAESFAREFGARRWYKEWQQLIADEEIEAVYIATPVHLHAAQTVAAAEAGKHVLCEKPMAMSVKECERMVAACEENKVRLGVAYYRHFYPAIDRIRTILGTGEIGKPILAQVNAFERFDPEESHPRRWLLEKSLSGGGPMFDFGCHRIEILLNLFGHVMKVRSLVGNVLFDREVEDTASALFQFEGGPQAVLSVTHAATEPQDTLNIFGSDGSIHVALLNEGTIKLKTSEGERVESHPPHDNLHQPLIDDFAWAVLKTRDPQVSGRVGLEVARIEEAIYGGAET